MITAKKWARERYNELNKLLIREIEVTAGKDQQYFDACQVTITISEYVDVSFVEHITKYRCNLRYYFNDINISIEAINAAVNDVKEIFYNDAKERKKK